MKINFRIPIIIVLVIILCIMNYFYFKDDTLNISNNSFDMSKIQTSKKEEKTTLSSTSQVLSSTTEDINLHATYYFEEVYVEENQLVKKGEKILKYTNGTYLTAPYDLIITKINIPNKDEKCTNNHFIEVSSNNSLKVSLSVDETKISDLSIGKSAKIKISSTSEEVDGVITKISNTANKGKFNVEVEFENTGDIKVGMTANVII